MPGRTFTWWPHRPPLSRLVKARPPERMRRKGFRVRRQAKPCLGQTSPRLAFVIRRSGCRMPFAHWMPPCPSTHTFPHQRGRTVPSTIPNVDLLKAYRIKVRYNEVKKRLEVTLPGHVGSSDNFDNVALTQIKSLVDLNGMSTGPIKDVVCAIGDQDAFNPVRDWIRGKPWDGRDRLAAFYATLRRSATTFRLR